MSGNEIRPFAYERSRTILYTQHEVNRLKFRQDSKQMSVEKKRENKCKYAALIRHLYSVTLADRKVDMYKGTIPKAVFLAYQKLEQINLELYKPELQRWLQ